MSLPTATRAPIRSRRFHPWLRVFEPAPPAPVILTDPAAVQEGYRRWQRRVLISTIIGYATFYFVRKNLGIAMPLLEKDLGISKSSLGLFLTLHGLLYGVSKFANGFLGDRCNGRAFMAVGLVASAAMNLFFGLSSAVITFGLFWMLNGWFQGMGSPACTRLMTHWFPPHQLATKMSIWNISHSIGTGSVLILCGYLAPINWRLCFFLPALIAFGATFYVWHTLPDTPPSVGLPELAGTESPRGGDGPFPAASGPGNGDEPSPPQEPESNAGLSPAAFRTLLLENVFRNRYIWLLALANFFVYTFRYAVLDWGPTLLKEAKHMDLPHASWMVAAFEISGLIGMLLSGWLTDRVFGGRGARTCLFFMALAGLSLLLFWRVGGQSPLWNTVLLCAAGFFIYGPQCLVGIIAANLATKHAAATAIGLTGLFGYASTLLSGWGLGALVEHHGWDAGFMGLMGVAVLGTLLFAAAWPAKAHGYEACR